jgi:WXG100 family type VII secretion target
MSANRLRVYCEDLTRASKAATDAANEIDNLRGKLGIQMDQLHNSWTGQAARAYLEVWAEINEGCGEMLTDLKWIGESTAACAAAYRQTEQSNETTIHDVLPGDGV